jgi:hypothetical protein
VKIGEKERKKQRRKERRKVFSVLNQTLIHQEVWGVEMWIEAF